MEARGARPPAPPRRSLIFSSRPPLWRRTGSMSVQGRRNGPDDSAAPSACQGARGRCYPSASEGDPMAFKLGFIPIEGGHYYRESLEEVTRAEELGFDSVWMEEHHAVTDHYWPSPLTVLAGFATRTSRVTLGTDILVAAFYHPVRLAEDVALLDVMSNGRFTLGVAIGYKPDEFALYGVDLEKRGARFDEQLAIMKGLWTEGRVRFRGNYYTVEGRLEPKPLTRPHPPVWIGGWGGLTPH